MFRRGAATPEGYTLPSTGVLGEGAAIGAGWRARGHHSDAAAERTLLPGLLISKESVAAAGCARLRDVDTNADSSVPNPERVYDAARRSVTSDEIVRGD